MLQSLISLRDDEIDIVLGAVTQWCRGMGVAVESEEGRRAITVAVNLICSRSVDDFPAELFKQLDDRALETLQRCA